MKIVHISHLYHPSTGGVQFFFKNVSERLVRDYGDEVTVVTTNSYYGPERRIFKKISPAEECINGVKVIRFSYRRWHIVPFSFIFKVLAKLKCKKPEWMGLQANGPYSPEMKKYLLQSEADAYCASSSNYYFMQLPLWKKCNFFYFGSIHLKENAGEDSLFKKQVESMNASTLYLANTTFEIDRLVKMGVKAEKIQVLGAGVDMKPFREVEPTEVINFKSSMGLLPQALVIGYTGRLEKTKNVLVLIKAFEKLAATHTHIYLLLAGSGSDYVTTLQQYCRQLSPSIQNRIKWQLNFPAEKKPVIFNSLDIFVLPSHNESFGIVFLEAWSCKKPVIGASIGAVRHVITEGKDGLLMNINDETSLCEKLEVLINNNALRVQLGENGFTKVQENYTWDIIVSRLRQCYLKGAALN